MRREEARVFRFRAGITLIRHTIISGPVHSHVPGPRRAAPVCIRRGRCGVASVFSGDPDLRVRGPVRGAGRVDHHLTDSLCCRCATSAATERSCARNDRRPKPLVATGVWGRHAALWRNRLAARSAMQACAGRQRRLTLITVDCRLDPSRSAVRYGRACGRDIEGAVPAGTAPHRLRFFIRPGRRKAAQR